MEHQPKRGDDIETWIKRERDRYKDSSGSRAVWTALDILLDDYRLHADTGVPLLSEEPMQ